jgi:hypothetical protein
LQSVAIKLHLFYGIYGTEAVTAIQWLCNPQDDQTPESVAAFVEEEGLSETLRWFRLHHSKKTLQYMKTIDPQDTIIVNNVRSQHLGLTLFMKLINMPAIAEEADSSRRSKTQ